MKTKPGHLLIIGCNQVKDAKFFEHLERFGYQISKVGDGSQALQMLTTSNGEQVIDLILLNMDPQVNGETLLEQLNQSAGVSHIPVIAISMQGNINHVARAIELGAVDYLIEPHEPILFKKRITACLEKKWLAQRETSHLKKLEWLTNDLQRAAHLSISLSTKSDLDQMLETILVEAKLLGNADVGILYLLTKKNYLEPIVLHVDSLDIALVRNKDMSLLFPPLHLYDTQTGVPNEANMIAYVAHTGFPATVSDVYEEANFDFSAIKRFDNQYNYLSSSSLTLPLKNNMKEVMGVMQFFNAQDPLTGQMISFDTQQQLRIEALTSLAAVILDNQMLLQQQQELLQCTRDMEIGREVQVGFLPAVDDLPRPDDWEIATRFYPAREVAGDFYDVFPLTQGRIGLIIADVCDKGVGAALFMALSRSLLRAFAEHPHRTLKMSQEEQLIRDELLLAMKNADWQDMPAKTDAETLLSVTLTNNYILNNHRGANMFATLFFGVLDPKTGTLTYINGGHNPPIIVDETGAIKSRLIPTGPAVGVLPDIEFEMEQIILDPGDYLLAFTDGVPDARDPSGKFFTESYLLSLLTQPALSAMSLLEHIEDRLWAHIDGADQFDDITMLALRRMGLSEAQRLS